jgi:uncharacterized membrane protein (DUF441 family)
VTVWLPWGVASLALTGAALPASGAASREIAHHFGWSNLQAVFGGTKGVTFDPAHVPWAWRADVAAKALFVWLLEQPLLAPLRLGSDYGVWPPLSRYAPYRLFAASPLLGLGAVAATALALRHAWRRVPAAPSDRPGMAFAIATYSAVLIAAYVFIAPAHWYFSRYLALPIWLTTIAVLAPIARFARPRPDATLGSWRGALAIALGCWVVLLQGSLLVGFRSEPVWAQPSTRGFLASWEALADRIPAEAKVGAFQAGIYSWFSDRPVRNLDGKVNLRARHALAQRRLHEYVLASDLDYVLDQPAITHVLMLRHTSPDQRDRFVPVARESRRAGAALYRIER